VVELIHDPDLLVCEAAVRSLGEIGDPSAADAVKQIVTSENDSLRSAGALRIANACSAVQRSCEIRGD